MPRTQVHRSRQNQDHLLKAPAGDYMDQRSAFDCTDNNVSTVATVPILTAPEGATWKEITNPNNKQKIGGSTSNRICSHLVYLSAITYKTHNN